MVYVCVRERGDERDIGGNESVRERVRYRGREVEKEEGRVRGKVIKVYISHYSYISIQQIYTLQYNT